MNKFEFIKNNFSLDFLLSMPTLWQLCAILAALGSSLFTNQIIKNYVVGSAVNNWKMATDGLVRIISPIIILIVLFLSIASPLILWEFSNQEKMPTKKFQTTYQNG